MALAAGAEPFHHDGGATGVLLCHGFTGSPASMRPWAEYLAAGGLTVSLPRLPGHGTRWQDMRLTTWDDWYSTVEKAFLSLSERCGQVFVMGLSMGGALALRMAELHGTAVSGVVVVNPVVVREDKLVRALPVLKYLVRSQPGISDDIKKEGVTEGAYLRFSVRAAHEMVRGLRQVKADLPKITQPLLLFRSPDDHVVPPTSGRVLLSTISSTDVEERLCADSYHVATLDHDAERIFTGSLDFVRRLSAGRATTTAES